MGTKYAVRTSEERVFPLETIGYTDYRPNNMFEFIKLLITKRKKVIFATRWFN